MIPYTPEQQAIRQWLSKPYPMSGGCCCLGPRDGEPVCPCAMSFVEDVDGAYYRVEEHRCPDGVTHSAKILLVERRLSHEEQCRKNIDAAVKEINDNQGAIAAAKEYRAQMYSNLGAVIPLKASLDYVRSLKC